MAQYFVLTFIGALLLGLIIPSVILVLIIVICRRRHRRSNPGYANSKLFNTNLWYYIGGNDNMFEDGGNGRNRSSVAGRGNGGGFLSSTTDDFMDLPDVVVPGGRLMQQNNMGTMRQNSATMGRPLKQDTMIPAGMMSSSSYDQNILGTLTMGRNQQQQQQMMQAQGINPLFLTMAGQQNPNVTGISQNMPFSTVSQPGIQCEFLIYFLPPISIMSLHPSSELFIALQP
ncbi:hypothetical protein Ciccas_006229 [Cichlidogyrus casuarinus]|uniref:Uncharacterized protein n=1 Tax=Cichlidogyrus casuarinus TaxID=1844966 RepID=A0ABD2Q6E6_9PLAT